MTGGLCVFGYPAALLSEIGSSYQKFSVPLLPCSLLVPGLVSSKAEPLNKGTLVLYRGQVSMRRAGTKPVRLSE